jgi:hypothetical protein
MLDTTYWCGTVSTVLPLLAIAIVSLVRSPYAIYAAAFPFSLFIVVKRYRKAVVTWIHSPPW